MILAQQRHDYTENYTCLYTEIVTATSDEYLFFYMSSMCEILHRVVIENCNNT